MLNRRHLLQQGGAAVGATLGAGVSERARAQSSEVQNISLSANGFQFDALAAGPTNGPLLILLHGFPVTKEMWNPILGLLGKQGIYAVAVDQRGYSPNARPPNKEDYVQDNLVSDVLGFANSLGVTQFHLVGHDWGSTIAWRCAVQHPDLVLSVTALSSPHPDAYIAALATDPDQISKSQYLGLLMQDPPIPENFMLQQGGFVGTFNRIVSQSDINFYLSVLQQPGAMTAALNWYRVDDLKSTIGPCTVPAVHVWGTWDAYNGKTAALATANHCTGKYEFVQLPNYSHWLLTQAPETVATIIQEQIKTLL